MKTKKEITENWLPRYTGRKLEEFTEYVLLTNFGFYIDLFSEKYNVPILSSIPIVQKIRESGDTGKPVALDEDTMLGQIFLDLAKRFVERVEKRNKELPPTKRVLIQH